MRQMACKGDEESHGIIQKSALFERIIDLEIKENPIGHYIVKTQLKSFTSSRYQKFVCLVLVHCFDLNSRMYRFRLSRSESQD